MSIRSQWPRSWLRGRLRCHLERRRDSLALPDTKFTLNDRGSAGTSGAGVARSEVELAGLPISPEASCPTQPASVGRVIASGFTQASNSSAVRKPDATAAARRVESSWCADLAIVAALS